MKKHTLFLAQLLIAVNCFSQYNLDFESFKPGTDTLAAWNIRSGSSYSGPLFNIDKEIKHGGNQSLSIERRNNDTATQFTPASVIIDADFEAKEVSFSCWIKTENVTGHAQMWITMLDVGGSNLQLANFPGLPGIKGTTDWKKYTTTLVLPEDTRKIYFGFLLIGTGKVWADDMEVVADNQPFDKRVIVSKPFYKALLDNKEFSKGSGIPLTNVDETQKQNLFLLARIWGFLKYYHPFIAKGNVNWDFELFRFLPSFLTVTNKRERNEMLLAWVNKLGQPGPCNNCSEEILGKAIYKPDLTWLNDKEMLGDSLSDALLYVKHNRHQGNNFYMQMMPTGNPGILHESGYGQFSYPDAGYRLLALFRYWNMIQYWFPYKHLIGEDWNQLLPQFIPKMLAATDNAEYLTTTRQLIARIRDTHANILGFNRTLDSITGTLYTFIKIKFVNDKAVVTKTTPVPYPGEDIRVGDIILAIDGKKVDDIIKEKLPDLPASNYSTQLRDLALILLRGNDSISNVDIDRDGDKYKTNLRRWDSKKINIPRYFYDFPYQKDSIFFFVRPGIGYINLGKIKKSEVDSIFRILRGSKGLIIDNRQYPADFPIYYIASNLLPQRTMFTKIPQGSLAYPGAFFVNKTLYAGGENKNYYTGKLVILVDENTQSSAEFHSMAFRITPGAIVIGNTTAAADGDVSYFYLPGGIYTRFSGISILNPDGSETQRSGIKPDIEVQPTIKGIKVGKDELLEKAIEIILSGRAVRK